VVAENQVAAVGPQGQSFSGGVDEVEARHSASRRPQLLLGGAQAD